MQAAGPLRRPAPQTGGVKGARRRGGRPWRTAALRRDDAVHRARNAGADGVRPSLCRPESNGLNVVLMRAWTCLDVRTVQRSVRTSTAIIASNHLKTAVLCTLYTTLVLSDTNLVGTPQMQFF